MRTIAGDITDRVHRSALVDSARETGSLDLVINNASTLGPSPLPSLDHYPLDDLRRVYDVNVFAPLALVQESLPLLRVSKGTVVSVSSDAAVEAYEGWGGYGSSKAALDQLHRVLAAEEPDVRVYLFDPGDMRTEMHQAAFPGEDISDRPEPESVVPALRTAPGLGPPRRSLSGLGDWRSHDRADRRTRTIHLRAPTCARGFGATRSTGADTRCGAHARHLPGHPDTGSEHLQFPTQVPRTR